MAKYTIATTKKFDKAYDKLNEKDRTITDEIIQKIADDEILEKKYKDHKLKGVFKGFKECHIKPDLLLIYKKIDDILILNAFRLGSHSELFK